MAELVREIVEDDLPVIERLAAGVRPGKTIQSVSRLGGMTNRSYRVCMADGEELLVRIPGEGTEKMINRSDERKSTALACRLGIDAELYYFDDDGYKVMHFIHDPQPMSEAVMQQEENLMQAARIFHKLHSCGEDTGVRFEVFEMAALYEEIIREGGVAFYEDYKDVRQTVMDIKAAVDADGTAPRVPCHNDSLMGNWVLDGNGKLYLIDWEYSGMNEAMWDLGCLSIEAAYNEAHDEALLEAYYGRSATVEEKKRFVAAKLYVDFLWTLWGLTRVPYDGQFMQEYADTRYARLKNNIENYRKLG